MINSPFLEFLRCFEGRSELSPLPSWGRVSVWVESAGRTRRVIRRRAVFIFYCVGMLTGMISSSATCVDTTYATWICGNRSERKPDTDRRVLTHTAQQSIMYIFHIKFSLPVFSTLMFAVMFSVHNGSGGVKLMLPHQEERTNNNQTLFPPLPTLFTTGSIRLSLCSHALSLALFFFFFSSALSCALRLEVLSVSSSKAWKERRRTRGGPRPVRLPASAWLDNRPEPVLT